MVNTIITFTAIYVYSKLQDMPTDRSTILKYAVLSNITLFLILYVVSVFCQGATFSEAFSFNHHIGLIRGGMRYIPELGESIMTGNAPF